MNVQNDEWDEEMRNFVDLMAEVQVWWVATHLTNEPLTG